MHKPQYIAHLLGCIISMIALLGASSLVVADESFGEKNVRLSNFTMENGPIRLDGTSDKIDIYIPLSTTAIISNTWVDLRFIHSIMLLGKRSSLHVSFNGSTLVQIPYESEQPNSRAKILIPDELWTAGYNKLTLTAVQHYTERCEDATSPELWTEVDLHDSVLNYTVKTVSRDLNLHDLSGLFSPGIGGLNSVLVLNSPKADLTKQNSSYLNKALPLVVQSLALRRDYSPLNIRHARWSDKALRGLVQDGVVRYIPGSVLPEGHVLVGTKSELAAVLPKTLVDRIDGPFLQLGWINAKATGSTASGTARKIRLIVSGTSGKEVILAARALAHMDDDMAALQWLDIPPQGEQEDSDLQSGNYFLEPDSLYSFAQLGTSSTLLQGTGTKRVTVDLPIRGNFYTHESASIKLALDFAYGAGMGEGSVMSVLLNGEYIQGLELNEPDGMAFRDYQISLPATMLHPGINNLEFEFSMRAETVAGECRSAPASHLMVQLLDSSSISLPNASAVATQPDLASFSATAFPYIDRTQSAHTDVAVASEKMLANALTLIGKLAQLSHSASQKLYVQTTIPSKPTNNTILLATPQEMPASIFLPVSESFERSREWSYHILNLVRTVQAKVAEQPAVSRTTNLTDNGRLDSLGVLMAMRNPHSASPAALMVITADTHNLLDQRMSDLLAPQIWGQLKGDLVAWKGPRDAVKTMHVGEYYEVGENYPWHRLILMLSNNPWYMLAALLITIAGISFLTRSYLRRREAKKLAE